MMHEDDRDMGETAYKILLLILLVIGLSLGFISIIIAEGKHEIYKCQDHSIYKKHGNGWVKINGEC